MPRRTASDLRNKKFLLIFTGLALASIIFLTPFCGLMYQCGCTTLWSGGAQQCNVYHETGPHCPWCKTGKNPILGLVPVFGILVGQALSVFYFSKNGKSGHVKLVIVGFLAFWFFGLLFGYVYKNIYDYPHFFFD
ncbi:MAG: hypothetical protein ACE5IR_08140 [bacterium]